MKPPKGKKKGDKTPCDSSSTASRLLPLLERWNLKPENPFFLIFRLYQQQFLDRSIHEGLIDPMHLSLAGDGTPVRTSAQQRKKRICDCKEKGCSSCNCKRQYSQPDCNWGWDSHRECYFFGYHLYMYVAADSYSDLPVFPLLERASRHDMLSFLHSFFGLRNSFWIPPTMLMLSMNTADGKISHRLSTSIPVIPDTSLIRTISRLTMTASQSASWAYVCIKMDMRLPNTGRNTGVQKRTGNVAVSVNIPVHRRNMAEPYTSLPRIIQGCLTYRQETRKHGKKNTTEGLPWNAPISVRKRTIN